jgi:uncharacterized membrane protein YoaK (UPF0700 family)
MHGEARVTTRVHNLLLALLAGAAGAVDALSFLRLGEVFTANMTGNTVLLGIAAGQREGARVLHSVTALVGFAVGVLVGAIVSGRGARSEGDPWPRRVVLTLGIELVILVGLSLGWLATAGEPGGIVQYGLIVAAALAMGLQSGAVGGVALPGVATTYVTGVLTGLVTHVAVGGASGGSLLRRAVVLVALLAGAAAGGGLVIGAPRAAPWIAVALVAAAVAVSARRPRRNVP